MIFYFHFTVCACRTPEQCFLLQGICRHHPSATSQSDHVTKTCFIMGCKSYGVSLIATATSLLDETTSQPYLGRRRTASHPLVAPEAAREITPEEPATAFSAPPHPMLKCGVHALAPACLEAQGGVKSVGLNRSVGQGRRAYTPSHRSVLRYCTPDQPALLSFLVHCVLLRAVTRAGCHTG